MPKHIWNKDLQSTQIDKDSYEYRSKYACFNCRSTYLKILPKKTEEITCTNCDQKAIDMGYLFQAPPKRNKRLWKKMETLRQKGFKFDRTGNVVRAKSFLKNHYPSNLK